MTSPFVVGNFCYGGNQYAAEILREDLHLEGITLKMCHEYPNADWPYSPDTIHAFIDSCDAIILPGRTKIQSCKSVNRLGMAWSRTKPVVVPGLDAYVRYAVPGENCLFAHNHDQWIEACVALRDDKGLRDKLAAQGHNTAQKNLHPTTYVSRFLEAVRETGAGVPWRADTFVQIIIPHYSTRKDYLHLAVEAAANSWGPSRDILVVSSSAIEPTGLEKSVVGRVHHSESRLSFSEANNVGLGMLHPNTTHVLLLNDDTIMGADALGRYTQAIGDQKIILNPYSNCDKGWLNQDTFTLENSGKDLHPNMKVEEFTAAELAEIKGMRTDGEDTSLVEAPFAAFYGTMMPKEIAERVGQLNTTFKNGGEDADFCYRARDLLGVKSYWTPNAFVFHFGGKTRLFSEEQNHSLHHEEDQANNLLLHVRWPKAKKRVGIWCGPGWEKWDLNSYRAGGSGLGGSETCAGRLAETMAADGHHVTLYGDIASECEQYGVYMVPWQNFKPEEEYFDLFVASRNLAPIDERLRAKRKVVVLHDIWLMSGQHISDYHRAVVDKFFVLTPWHYDFVKGHHALPDEKLQIVPNGVNVEIFDEFDPSKKVPGKMIWTSSPDRGLDNLLYCLPWIQERVAEAHLDVYYGWHNYKESVKSRNDVHGMRQIENLQKAIDDAHGVSMHGRIDQHDLAKKWAECSLWGYPTTFTETYCLSAKEAQCSGTPIVCSDVAALSTTVGDYGHLIHHQPYSKEGRVEFVEKCVELLSDREKWVAASARSLEGSKGISWDDRYADYWRAWVEG